jgi:hypothetical protein
MSPSYLRNFAVMALIACAVMTTWTGAAAARPIDDPSLDTTHDAVSTTETRTVAAGEGSDRTLPMVVAGAVALVLIGAAGHARRSHASRRVTA